jgi:hypothetical protein
MNQPTMTMTTTAIDTSTLQRVGGQLGSNYAGIFQDDNGRRYYVKTLESVAHARNELIAARLYQLAGAPTLSYVPTQAPDQIATVWLALDKRRVARFSTSELKQAQQWLGVHAWTANWDVAGFDGDNQGIINGQVLTLDVGGALAFRAHGDPKGRAFGTHVGELDTLRNDKDNPHAARLFANMGHEAVQQAIMKVVQIPDAQIHQCIQDNAGSPSLAHKMIARKNDMAHSLLTASATADVHRGGA